MKTLKLQFDALVKEMHENEAKVAEEKKLKL